MALANQFDMKEPQDFLRGLSNVLLEYELMKEDSDKPKMVRDPSTFERRTVNMSVLLAFIQDKRIEADTGVGRLRISRYLRLHDLPACCEFPPD